MAQQTSLVYVNKCYPFLFPFLFLCSQIGFSFQAFIDVERDLNQRETPMDRLICGDVGFGKTEVALRAIFCIVSAGKQAMVLAPTIVLAKQHFDVISERFSKYSHIKVALLSRFQVHDLSFLVNSVYLSSWLIFIFVFISCTQRVSMKKNLDKISLEIVFVGSL